MPAGKLGRRHPDPERSQRTLKIADYLKFKQVGLTPPLEVDHFAKVRDWGLYRNDTFSICGPTSAANLRKLVSLYVTGVEHSPSQEDVDALYALQNPGFTENSVPEGPEDQGVNLQQMCDDLVNVGIGGVKALAHAAIDIHSQDELRECVTLFGGLLLGVNLEQAQQQQTQAGIWNYEPSPEWGGHAILFGKYASHPDRGHVITWAEDVIFTDSFELYQLEEARVVIWEENLKLGAFQRGVDLHKLAADYKQLTGRDFPMTSPDPQPDTPPEPAPAPDPAPDTPPAPVSDPVAQIVAELEQQMTAAVQDAVAKAQDGFKGELSRVRDLVTQLDSVLTSNGV